MHGIVNAGIGQPNGAAVRSRPTTLYLLFVIGGLTALIGASAMLTQSSVKRTLGLFHDGADGLMGGRMECGLGAFALLFHLCAHGLFKATLFLNPRAVFIRPGRNSNRLLATGRGEPRLFTDDPGPGLAVTLVLPLILPLRRMAS